MLEPPSSRDFGVTGSKKLVELLQIILGPLPQGILERLIQKNLLFCCKRSWNPQPPRDFGVTGSKKLVELLQRPFQPPTPQGFWRD